jgi:hypothetical protein
MKELSGDPFYRCIARPRLHFGGNSTETQALDDVANIRPPYFVHQVLIVPSNSQFARNRSPDCEQKRLALSFPPPRQRRATVLMKPTYLTIDRRRAHVNNGRCSACKNVIYDMVRRIYGTIQIEHKLNIPAVLSDYRLCGCYSDLKKVFSRLRAFRHFDDFVNAKFLSPVDIYVPSKDFIIELDENQHFSEARAISLRAYPTRLRLGFKKKHWIKECKRIDSKDPSPPYRDEQRAWYDTLRDFLPLIDGFGPTVRVMVNDFEWCTLDSESVSDRRRFRELAGL